MVFVHSTVVSALGLTPHPLLIHIQRVLRTDPGHIETSLGLPPGEQRMKYNAVCIHKLTSAENLITRIYTLMPSFS